MEPADSKANDFKLFMELQREDPALWVNCINEKDTKIWYKDIPDTDLYYMKIETYVEGDYDFDKFADLTLDIEKMKQWDKNAKVLDLVETIDENTDILYMEIKIPFPFENRDLVQKRTKINNKKHPELIKKYGLFEREEEYIVIQVESVERSDRPPVKGKVRGKVVLTVFLMEKDPKVRNRINIKIIMCNDIKMKVPPMLRKFLLKQMGKAMAKTFANAYKRIYKIK